MKTIFVVDDSDTSLLRAEESLEENYQVMTIPSAAKMFVLLEKFTPDMILLDIQMPEMDGFEALERLKSNPLYKGIPVIFLTGYMDDDIEARGRALGALDIIAKPFSASALLERITAHL
ncbi:MAG: response regulator [Treponema sp.]|jgi:putative two-component system response regulator|nr:response regulator [Treponema sp.]